MLASDMAAKIIFACYDPHGDTGGRRDRNRRRRAGPAARFMCMDGVEAAAAPRLWKLFLFIVLNLAKALYICTHHHRRLIVIFFCQS